MSETDHIGAADVHTSCAAQGDGEMTDSARSADDYTSTVPYARERFLSAEAVGDDDVRRLILASWKRSQDHHVGTDQVTVPFLRAPDLETPLARSAAPILDALHEQLTGEPVSTILTDHVGVVVDRRCPDPAIAVSLDGVQLAPGFSYAEQFAGTNGIGTALSSARPALVDGREHYTHDLGLFACAGAPIRHPTQRRVVGILDLTTWRNTSGSMLLALAVATAKQIEEEMLAQTGLREFALFQEYLNACQHTNGAVLALNNDVVMMNEQLRQLVDPADQHALLSYSADTLAGTRETIRTVELPSGRTANLRYKPATTDAGPAGGVFTVRLVQDKSSSSHKAAAGNAGRSPLSGVVGSRPAWLRCIQQIDACYEAGDWMSVEGEPGVGKVAALRGVHLRHNPAGHLRVFGPPTGELTEWIAELRTELATAGAMIVIAHTERFSEPAVSILVDALMEGAQDEDVSARARVAITRDTPVEGDADAALLPFFPRTVEVPPLRHHVEDIRELVPHLLAQLSRGRDLTCSPQVIAQLLRLNWPGNVSQLRRVLAEVVKRRHSGVIQPDDLPEECRSLARRVLTPREARDRDAIVRALLDNDRNPTQAARSLGMSRATIYRRIHNYGVVVCPSRARRSSSNWAANAARRAGAPTIRQAASSARYSVSCSTSWRAARAVDRNGKLRCQATNGWTTMS